MPKISDERRAERRRQILNAAWTCFQREGLHATTMDDIIRASGLSAGAVYSYFRNKEELIVAALTTSMSEIGALVQPLLHQDPLPPPDILLRELMETVSAFSKREGFDLKRIALLGWSEAQRNERLREIMQGYYLAFRKQFAEIAATWQARGVIAAAADPEAVARTMLSLILGFVVQAAVVGGVDPEAVSRGLRDLGPPPAVTPRRGR